MEKQCGIHRLSETGELPVKPPPAVSAERISSALRQTPYGQGAIDNHTNEPRVPRPRTRPKIAKGISMIRRLSISTAIFAAMAAPAFAHINPAEHGSLMSGLSHPFSGADHLLAMLAVGLWAAQIGGKARLVVPASFVTMMAAGFLLAMHGAALPFVEPAILASVVGLGLLVAIAAKAPLPVSAGVVGLFALFHGHAHGSELGAATPVSFALGFVIATATLHAIGLGLGMVLAGRHAALASSLGVLTALCGAALALA
jgi:urease accessory protein